MCILLGYKIEINITVLYVCLTYINIIIFLMCNFSHYSFVLLFLFLFVSLYFNVSCYNLIKYYFKKGKHPFSKQKNFFLKKEKSKLI